MPEPDIRAAEVVLPCVDLDETLSFFTDRLGFRLETLLPADDPAEAVVSGFGVRLRLLRGHDAAPGLLRLRCGDPDALAGPSRALTAPNGTRIELVDADPLRVLPPLVPSLVVTHASDEAPWVAGRAGMRYRDLIPDRQGGRFIASHIHIPKGGPVDDWVHYHKVRFQMIFCHRGWVRVVYEDQGPPFVLLAGDCVLQPPEIRHRVLESSPDLEVLEVSCPAEHETWADPDRTLPTPAVREQREFAGQRFVRSQLASATWEPARLPGFESRDLGIAAATGDLAGVRVLRRASAPSPRPVHHDAELLFWFVREGGATLRCEERTDLALGPADAVVVPPGMRHALVEPTADLELVQVTLPAAPHFRA